MATRPKNEKEQTPAKTKATAAKKATVSKAAKPAAAKKATASKVAKPAAAKKTTASKATKPASSKAASYSPSDKEEYMCAAQLEYFRNVLQAWKADVLESSQQAITSLQTETSTLADLNDRATLEEEFTLTLRSQDRERRLVRKINKAIERINIDDFGFCDRCGAEIGLKRLEARPTAELCIDCKELEEKREKTMAE